jgi:2-oxo-4-hydroxy-4-carboxy-5-ureidoimidazoline decarboxylase
MKKATIDEVNQMTEEVFVETFGTVFEHSPWVAQRSYGKKPFADLTALHSAMCQTLQQASREEQLALIVAHPDLGDRLGKLTAASQQEQVAAGLDTLTIEELAEFKASNAAYKAKFGFPFVICARLNDKRAMLSAFARRLQNHSSEEFHTALAEIEKIAGLRLQAIVG